MMASSEGVVTGTSSMYRIWISGILVLTCSPLLASGAIRTVDDDLADYSQAEHSSIQEAIDVAFDGDLILVHPGDYTGSGDAVVNTLGKAVTIRATDGPEVTLIRGEVSRRGIQCSSGEQSTTLIEGFTITNCHAPTGGGISCTNASHPTFLNCVVIANIASLGGGIHCGSGSSPIFSECAISDNIASGVPGHGAGIACDGGSEAMLIECLLSGNLAAKDGGGLHVQDAWPILLGCVVRGNQATSNGGGMSWSATNSLLGPPASSGATALVSQCDVLDNTATVCGGGAHFLHSHIGLENVVFRGNSATGGGGISCYYSGPRLTACRIVANTGVGPGSSGGGAHCFGSSSPLFTNCVISNNGSEGRGGGVSCRDGGNPILAQCTIADNHATDLGGGVHSDNATATLTDSMLCGNEPSHLSGPWNGSGNTLADVCIDSCPDATHDGSVNVRDLLYLLQAWYGTDENADFNDDGIVDISDLAAAMEGWGPCV